MKFSYVLAFASCFLHAWWNFVLKRAQGAQLFIGLSKVAEAAILAVPFLWLAQGASVLTIAFARVVVVGAVLTGVNYFALGKAYQHGDLSVVYPISRAGALVFIPAFAFFFVGEKISAFGFLCIASIIASSVMLQLNSLQRDSLCCRRASAVRRTTLYVCLAALTMAGYAVWDGWAVKWFNPFLYFYAYTLVIACGYAVVITNRYRRSWTDEIRRNWKRILQVGLLNTMTYLLVLFALRNGKTTYVIAVRQMSIGIGALLGWLLLGETCSGTKKLALVTLMLGCAFISLAD